MLKLVAMAKHDIGKGNVQSTEEVFAAAGARLRQRDEQGEQGPIKVVWGRQRRLTGNHRLYRFDSPLNAERF